MSGALLERVRLSAYLVLACLLGSVVWMLDAAWGWSAGGWMTLRFGFHDSIASAVVHGVSGAFTLGVLFNLGPRIGKYTKEGLDADLQAPQHPHDPDGADADLHRLLRLLRRLPGDRVHGFPGWANIYLSPTTLGSIAMIITFGLRRRLHRRLLHQSQATRSGRSPAGSPGVIGVSAGADVYAPTMGYLLAMVTAVLVVYVGNWIEEKMRVDDVVGAVAVHGFSGFLGIIWVGVFAAGYPPVSTTSTARSGVS